MPATTGQNHDGFHRDARQMLTGHLATPRGHGPCGSTPRSPVRQPRTAAPGVLDRSTMRPQADEQALRASGVRNQLDVLATAIERCDAGTYGLSAARQRPTASPANWLVASR